jgi:protease IV
MAKFSEYLSTAFFLLLLLQFAPPLLRGIKNQYSRILEPRTRVACITIKQPIMSSTYYVRNLQKFFKDTSIKALVLRIESPGGAAGAAEAIAHEIEQLKHQHPKPIVGLTENICASGGYYVMATADLIFASPSTIIGSIGAAIPFQFKLGELLEQYKIYYESITAGKYKSATDPFEKPNPEQQKLLLEIAQDSAQNFTEHIARHRPKVVTLPLEAWTEGKIFTGRQALALGLIDAIGSWTDVTSKVKDLIGIRHEEKIEWVRPEKPSGFWGLFSDQEYGDDGYVDEPTLRASLIHTLSSLVISILQEFQQASAPAH